MPFEHRIDAGLLELRAYGELSFASWVDAMRRATSDHGFTRGMPVLFDAREGTTLPEPGEGKQVADTWMELVPGSRVAIIVAPNSAQFGVARQVSILSRDWVMAFSNLDAALVWLRGSPRRDG